MNKFKKSIFLLTILLISTNLYSQKSKFGKVTVAELKQLEHPNNKEAGAVVLNQEGLSRIEFQESTGTWVLNYTVYKKIKIYKKEKIDLANVSFRLFIDETEKSETLGKINAISYNLSGSKIEKTKLKNENIFKTRTSDYYNTTNFFIPNVKEGSIIEYRYTVTSPFVQNVPTWYFQYNIPVNHSEYIFETPQYFDFETVLSANTFVKPEESSRSKSFKLTNNSSGGFSLNSDKTKSYSSYNYLANIEKFEADNIPAIISEDYIISMDDYRQSINYQLISINLPYKGNEYISKTWNDVAYILGNSRSFGKQLKKNIKSAESIIGQAKTQNAMDRLNTIFSYVQENYTWDGNYSLTAGRSLNELIESKTGSSGEINLLLINLLQESGIPALPVVTKIKSDGQLNVKSPSLNLLNYVMGAVNFQGKTLYLDATDKFGNIGEIPEHARNTYGLTIDGNNATILEISNPNVNYKSSISSVKLNSNNLLEISSTTNYKGIVANNKRRKISELTNIGLFKQFEEKLNNIEYDSLFILNIEAKSQPFQIKTYSSGDNYLEVISDKLYINPFIGNHIITNPFTEENRAFPIYLPFQTSTSAISSISIPSGFKIESLPEGKTINLLNNSGSFTFSIQLVGESLIQISSALVINETFFSQDNYEVIKNFYDEIIKIQKQRVVVSKK